METLEQWQSRLANRPHQTSIKSQAQKRKFALSDPVVRVNAVLDSYAGFCKDHVDSDGLRQILCGVGPSGLVSPNFAAWNRGYLSRLETLS